MPASAAAVTAGRRKQLTSGQKDQRAREYQERRQRMKQRAIQIFDELSTDGESLPTEQLDTYVAKVMRKSSLQPQAVQLVRDTVEREDTTKPSGALSKDALVNAVFKYGEYIQKADKIDAAFDKYDTQSDGQLQKSELTKLLQDYERKANRSKDGIVIRLVIEPEDVDWVIQQSDADGNGDISQAEYLPAIAAWEELAQMKVDQQGADGCCVIL